MPSNTTVNENEIEEKLRSLYDLQLIDSRRDQINNALGELPLEVEDLENDIKGYIIKIEKIEEEKKELQLSIDKKKKEIAHSQDLIVKYKKQQEGVRNNREFNSINKEVEYQELEIQLSEKRISEYKSKIEHKSEILEELKLKLKRTKDSHIAKQSELEDLMKGTEKEKNHLNELSEKYKSKIEPRLLKAYEKIRERVKNGMAVVSVERGASEGSYFTLPPQKQFEISQRKKIMIDEHSGRILVDPELAEEEKQKMESELKPN